MEVPSLVWIFRINILIYAKEHFLAHERYTHFYGKLYSFYPLLQPAVNKLLLRTPVTCLYVSVSRKGTSAAR